MKCKYCNEEMPERGHFCPICGGDNSMEPEEIVITPEELLHAVDEVAEKETVQLMAGEEFGAQWYCAGAITKKGHPHHPLYLRKDEQIKPFDVKSYLDKL